MRRRSRAWAPITYLCARRAISKAWTRSSCRAAKARRSGNFWSRKASTRVCVAHAARGGAIFGTCAGAILLAREVHNPAQESLGLADITVIRNAYGRQLASEVRHGATAISPEPIEMVFIRAPIIERVGPDVEVLGKSEGQPVLIRQGHILIATFHPELTSDTTVHEYFLRMARATAAQTSVERCHPVS